MANKLVFETALDGTGFERGLQKLGETGAHHLKNFVAGAFGVYSIHQALHRTVESAEELVTASKRLDVPIEQLQILRQAAKENLTEFGKLEQAFERLNVKRGKALQGDAAALAAFARLGVSVGDLKTKTAADLFTGPIAGAVKSGNSADLAGPLREIFRSYGALIPILKTDFEELGEKMRHLGSIMSTEDAVAAKLLAEEFGLLSNIITAQLAPAFGYLGDKLIWALGQVQAFGAFIGGFFGSFEASMKSGAAKSGPFNFMAGLKDTLEAIPEAVMAGGFEAIKVLNANQDTRDSLSKAIKDAADALKNPKPPELNPPDKPKSTRRERGGAPATDSLLSVGNFLGGGANAINAVAEQQLQVARQQLTEAQKTNSNLEKLNDRMDEIGDIEVP